METEWRSRQEIKKKKEKKFFLLGFAVRASSTESRVPCLKQKSMKRKGKPYSMSITVQEILPPFQRWQYKGKHEQLEWTTTIIGKEQRKK